MTDLASLHRPGAAACTELGMPLDLLIGAGRLTVEEGEGCGIERWKREGDEEIKLQR